MKRILVTLILLSFCGCNLGFKQMGSTEYGILFRKIPTYIGGGIGRNIIPPGKMVWLWPWEEIYRFDTSVKDISWGPKGQSADSSREDFIHTRALDGNEVAIALTVRYKLSTDEEKLKNLARSVALSNEDVAKIVDAITRADVRTYMNELHTSEFLDKEHRYSAVDKVKANVSSRLEAYGITVERINLDDFRFERLLNDGSIDRSYQDKLEEIQRIREDTERENSRIETVKAKKEQELNDVKAQVNRQVAEAEGARAQAESRGVSYLEARRNEAKAILAQGKAEVEGLVLQINALQGPGGKALLKLDIAKELVKSDPRFIVMGEGGSSQGVEVNRTDTNELLRQIGILDGLKQTESKEKPVSKSAP